MSNLSERPFIFDPALIGRKTDIGETIRGIWTDAHNDLNFLIEATNGYLYIRSGAPMLRVESQEQGSDNEQG